MKRFSFREIIDELRFRRFLRRFGFKLSPWQGAGARKPVGLLGAVPKEAGPLQPMTGIFIDEWRYIRQQHPAFLLPAEVSPERLEESRRCYRRLSAKGMRSNPRA